MDYFQRRWAREKDTDWNSLYDSAFSLGRITATDTFDLDRSTVRSLSKREGDSVRVIHTDDEGYTDYDIVNADSLKDYSYGVNKESPRGYYCAQIGANLVFNHTFTADDQQFGGEIFIPAYIYPDAITDENPDSDEVQVDDPDWLITRCAAEYVRNDITRRQRFPELLTESNTIMERMKDDNEGQISEAQRDWTPFSGLGNDSAFGG
jgi:formylmethanofuran dehydrogenase subunit D